MSKMPVGDSLGDKTSTATVTIRIARDLGSMLNVLAADADKLVADYIDPLVRPQLEDRYRKHLIAEGKRMGLDKRRE